MPRPLLIAAALLTTVLARPPAFAQPRAPDGSGTEPLSTKASNTGAGDTHAGYAPRLPEPTVGPDASPRDLLTAARQDLAAHRTGAAQEALERAQTRLLDRTVDPSLANIPDGNPMVAQIAQARHLLGSGDVAGALRIIDDVLSAH